MLKNTFIHVPGLGIKSEQRIWSSGICSWADISGKEATCFSPYKREIVKQCIGESVENLSRGNPNYFGDLLTSYQFWRFFPEFGESTAYLDIKTTGLDSWGNTITTIALYDGRSIFTCVQGHNLDKFKEDIQR